MIHRAEHDNEFVRVKNSLVNDESLSFEARGFLVFLLALPDSWSFSIKGLAYKSKLSEYTVMRLIKELKSAGYVTQKKVKNHQGQFTTYEWDVYELPELDKNRTSVKPNFSKTELRQNRTSATPNFGETQVIETTNTNKQINITNDSLEQTNKAQLKKFTPPTVEEVRAYCQERGNTVDPEAFCDFYTSKGWKVGKNTMKDWKAAVRTWEKRDRTPKPLKASGNEFTDLLGQEGFTI